MLPRIEEPGVERCDRGLCELGTITLYLHISCMGAISILGVVIVVIILLLISGNITLL